MITTRAYFTLNSELPFVSDDVPSASLVGNISEADNAIKRYEPEILTKTLGYPLKKAFMDQFDYNSQTNLNTIKDDADQKWKDLLKGKTYTMYGKTVIWRGIIFTDEDVDRSFITNYVYCKWLEKDTSKHLGVGLSKPKAKGSTRVRPTYKYTEAYNEFVSMVVGNYCHGNSDVIGTGERSLYEFLNDMNELDASTYPNWLPKAFSKVNVFSL
ncbi:hypothetical protein [uncultured Winogradskyella sp.]|uniref:hypothetical protein n=1 Tax=uncultured Winogradskyella sp. TaxID=395353 RepID=UPI0026363E07|nr:hypothetical protein [uncultured Winogradskyella sp.]